MIKPSFVQILEGRKRFEAGDRPWRLGWSEWHILFSDGGIAPLKYVYGLATNTQPSTYSTSQVKTAVRDLRMTIVNTVEPSRIAPDFDAQVEAALADPQSRAKRLAAANPVPGRRLVATLVFNRNPDVVAATLERANGRCEVCLCVAPFNRKTNGTPYLEVHHRIRLADDGMDTVANAIALCPNCHRQAHYG
jgi:5-methylcytosine-specific restriction protein A